MDLHLADLVKAPPGCHGPGACQGAALTLLFGCEHEHVGSEEACEKHVAVLGLNHRTGHRAKCLRCNHPGRECLLVYRVKETGEEFRFGQLGAWR